MNREDWTKMKNMCNKSLTQGRSAGARHLPGPSPPLSFLESSCFLVAFAQYLLDHIYSSYAHRSSKRRTRVDTALIRAHSCLIIARHFLRHFRTRRDATRDGDGDDDDDDERTRESREKTMRSRSAAAAAAAAAAVAATP